MDADTAPTRTAGAAFPQGTSSTDLRWKTHGLAWLKRHLLLVRTADALLLPIKLKGCLEKARAIVYAPGFAVDHHISRPLADHFFFSSRRRHTRSLCDWSSDVCSSD